MYTVVYENAQNGSLNGESGVMRATLSPLPQTLPLTHATPAPVYGGPPPLPVTRISATRPSVTPLLQTPRFQAPMSTMSLQG